MTREQYIERLIAIYKLRYKPSQEEIEEFKLLLEMMPDTPRLNFPDWPPYEPKRNPFEQPPVVVMYGVQVPHTTYDDAQTTYTMTKTDEKGR